MGVAAYNRASKCISNRIDHDYRESGSVKRDLHDQFVRAELQIERLEQFCRDAQSFFVDARHEEDAKTPETRQARSRLIKKQGTKTFTRMMNECQAAHNQWVDSDRRASFEHISVCTRKAKAWKAVLSTLLPGSPLPFYTPPHI